VRKILGFLLTVKHPPGAESMVPEVPAPGLRTEVGRSINVFGSIDTAADIQPTRREFVCRPGIETYTSFDEPNRERGRQEHLKKRKRHLPMPTRPHSIPLPALCFPTAWIASHSSRTFTGTDRDLPQVWISGYISA